jgi:lipoprotein-anchoring transpeptidase ErfK/SrfK
MSYMPTMREDAPHRTRSARRSLGFLTRPALAILVLGSGVTGCSLFAKPEKAPEVVADPGPGYPHLRLNLTERRVYLVEDPGNPGESFPVAIGRKPWETPVGTFRINEMVENPDWLVVDFKNPNKKVTRRVPPGPNNPLGLRWISFASAHGWEVGFHGTSKTHLLGQAVSHGCVRMKNDDVVKVYSKVKLGTTVIVEP